MPEKKFCLDCGKDITHNDSPLCYHCRDQRVGQHPTISSDGTVTFTPIQWYLWMFDNAADWPSFCHCMELPTKFGMSEDLSERMHPGDEGRAWLQKTFPQYDWSIVSMHWDT